MKMPVKQIQEFTQTEMSREEFLKFMGAGLLGIIGVWGLLNNLKNLQTKGVGKSGQGYGSSSYGG
jgi:hypothetical protein